MEYIINSNLFLQENVVPPSATALVNFRIHPAQTVNDVVEFTKKIIADLPVQIKVKRSREAHPISPHGPHSVPYQMISTSIRQVFSQAIVVPGKSYSIKYRLRQYSSNFH